MISPQSVKERLGAETAREPLVPVACGLCGGQDARLEKIERGFRVVRCGTCGHFYVSPRPSAAALLRDYQEYLPDDAAGIEAWRAMMEPCERAAAEVLAARLRPGGRILDVGCGYGFFLARMRERGFDVRGVEPAEGARRFAAGRLGLDVRAETLESARFAHLSFDAVTAFYVIEHVPDPLDFVRRARALLRPGGVLMLRYPDSVPVGRLLHALRLDGVPVYDAPFHLNFFRPATIARLLEIAGYDAIEHVVGGHTSPPRLVERWISTASGTLAGAIERATRGRLLLPGVSKCVLARRP